ncbi:acetyl-CoA--acetoacetyl-CoA transferase subunit alpha [Rhodospirillum rubrum]|uniref:CoA transferase subunit A n=1 Tax=Rhodospirillum rubrum TaxID=1085 RepID=UPI0019039F40|nr:3-oxoacid CoA-transferase subunit A [Rhodospirillum rubrum]MBK1663192.1 acetyl-CoA--acetoacetyl-CoA transferase subunit alpha [Rhodospirillum rubrum]MBK1676995.1 acetyl-CoA--acetoacetyl-CoA transferase subunit alpha [Rhodospirillum rubrum]
MSKITPLEKAVARIPDGAVLMIGGFMGAGTPHRLMDELVRQGKRDLTVIANDTARPAVGIGKLIDAGLVSKVIASHIGTNPQTQKLMIAGTIEVALIPQGTLAEQIRAGGSGLGGVITPTGVGTLAAEGMQTIELAGKSYLIALPLRADFALINAKAADYRGNLRYAMTSRNFNPLMAMAAETVIAEAEDFVPIGAIEPDAVATPHVLIDVLIAKERSHG